MLSGNTTKYWNPAWRMLGTAWSIQAYTNFVYTCMDPTSPDFGGLRAWHDGRGPDADLKLVAPKDCVAGEGACWITYFEGHYDVGTLYNELFLERQDPVVRL